MMKAKTPFVSNRSVAVFKPGDGDEEQPGIRVRPGGTSAEERARTSAGKAVSKTKAFSTRIEEDLLRKASDAALLKGVSLRTFIEEALRDHLKKMLGELGAEFVDSGSEFRVRVRTRPGRPLRASAELRRIWAEGMVKTDMQDDTSIHRGSDRKVLDDESNDKDGSGNRT